MQFMGRYQWYQYGTSTTGTKNRQKGACIGTSGGVRSSASVPPGTAGPARQFGTKQATLKSLIKRNAALLTKNGASDQNAERKEARNG